LGIRTGPPTNDRSIRGLEGDSCEVKHLRLVVFHDKICIKKDFRYDVVCKGNQSGNTPGDSSVKL